MGADSLMSPEDSRLRQAGLTLAILRGNGKIQDSCKITTEQILEIVDTFYSYQVVKSPLL